MDTTQIKLQVAGLPLDQLQHLIVSVNEEHDPQWQEKTRAIVQSLEQHAQFEMVGKTVTIAQALDLIAHHFQWEQVHRGKLAALLAGLPNSVFIEILANAGTSQLEVLKKEGIPESLQHHLLALYHGAWSKTKELDPKIITLEQEITALTPIEMSWEDKKAVDTKIEMLSREYRQILNPIDKALSIAWNAALSDLVEKLSEAKEYYQRVLSKMIGYPYRNFSNPAQGLYALLETQLSSIYGNPQNSMDTDALSDNDPAIEGLTKLSIWYPEDYFDLGLLPEIASREELKVLEEGPNRDQLVNKAAEALSLLGLRTVKDLKKAWIFSRKSLEEWLAKRKTGL